MQACDVLLEHIAKLGEERLRAVVAQKILPDGGNLRPGERLSRGLSIGDVVVQWLWASDELGRERFRESLIAIVGERILDDADDEAVAPDLVGPDARENAVRHCQTTSLSTRRT